MSLVPVNIPRRVQVFIASSLNELKVLRLELGLFVYKHSELYYKNKDIFFSPFLCEYHSQAFKHGRNQDELNTIVSNSELCCILIGNQVGKRTEEEFEVALDSFLRTGMPRICVFIRDSLLPSLSVSRFKKKLKAMGRDYSLYTSSTKIINNMEAEFRIWYQEWEHKVDSIKRIREKGRIIRDSIILENDSPTETWTDICDCIFSHMQFLESKYSYEYFTEESDYLFDAVNCLIDHGFVDIAYEYANWLDDYYDTHSTNSSHAGKVNQEHRAELKLFIGRWLFDECLYEESLTFCEDSIDLYCKVYKDHHGLNRIERADRFLELSDLVRDLRAYFDKAENIFDKAECLLDKAEYLLGRAEAICRHTTGAKGRLLTILIHEADLYDSRGRKKKADSLRREISSLESNQV